MVQRSLTLLLSDIARHLPVGEDWPAMPALQKLLARGTGETLRSDLSRCLFEHFQLPQEEGSDLPLAALSALGDGLDASHGWWLRVDPVHMVADRDQLYLSASGALGLSQSETDGLIAELNRLYADDGWQFVAATPQRWYLRLPQPLVMRTIPTVAAMGRRVGEVLPQGDDGLDWQRVMTEIQMLLHASPVNTPRSEQGLLTVNSLWFWGGGSLPQVRGECGWSRVLADDPLARGLAQLHGVSTGSSSPSMLEALASAGERVLWQVTVASLADAEQQLFAPLLARLQSGELGELVIELPGVRRWQIERAALRRWWRFPKSLASLLQGTR